MPKNYVLIDYENVQPDSISALDRDDVHILIFMGASQTKVNVEIAMLAQKMGTRAEYIKICGNGNNALDFHIAYYLGELTNSDPKGYFHIVSKDTGFDPLIQYLTDKKIKVCRSKAIADIPILQRQPATENKTLLVIERLAKVGSSKPRTMKTLGSTINALFNKELSEKEITAIINDLKKARVLEINQSKVNYLK